MPRHTEPGQQWFTFSESLWEHACRCCCIASVASDSAQPHRRLPTNFPRPWDSPGKNTGVGCHFPLQCVKVKSENEVAQSCPTLSDPMDRSLPGSSVHGIFQARVLKWGAIAFSVETCLVLIKVLADISACPSQRALPLPLPPTDTVNLCRDLGSFIQHPNFNFSVSGLISQNPTPVISCLAV